MVIPPCGIRKASQCPNIHTLAVLQRRYLFEGLDFGVVFVSWEEVTEELAGHSLFFVEVVFGWFGLGGLVARF